MNLDWQMLILFYPGIPLACFVICTIIAVIGKAPMLKERGWLKEFFYLWLFRPLIAVPIAYGLVWYLPIPQLLSTQTPLLFEVLACYLVFEFSAYLLHRAFHNNGFLYRFHATHHAVTTLTWPNSKEDHVVFELSLYVLFFITVAVLGISTLGMLLTLFSWSFLLAMSHMPIEWRYGIFDYVFLSPIQHELHHDPAGSRGHYGVTLSLFDHILGTTTYQVTKQ